MSRKRKWVPGMAAALGRPSLDALPDSLLLEILSQLPLRERLRGARVCRRWRRLVQDKVLWRHVDLTPYEISSRILWHLLRHHLRNNVRTLKVRGTLCSSRKQEFLSPALLQALGKQCPGLQRLCLVCADLRRLPYDFMPSSLMTLELSRCEIPGMWFRRATGPDSTSAPPQLKHLFIYEVPSFSDWHLLDVSSQTRLQTLTLCGTYRVTDAGLQRAAPHLEALEHLTLRQCILTDFATHFIGRYMKQLRTLEFSDAPSLTDAGLACLVPLKYLETLCLASCAKLSCDAIVTVGQALPQLRNLNLSGISFDDQAIRKIQASLPNCCFSPP
ncbi:F-box/LRR-repeat protein 12 [Alligator sinensis]|uniref:F-box/LRR-repeat protein 12 n=2 Tax=Alligator TaxID=8495 RepID=A0A1U7S314_ALLSI|nr:F-box/LRR-repeat protein 12 [Alligator sinensis]